MEDIFYVDYRTGGIVKNLDTSYMAPEFYNEVIVDEVRAGSYEYTYTDGEDNYLKFAFTQLELTTANVPFEYMVKAHFGNHRFSEDATLVRKVMYVTQEEFDKAPKGYKD